MHTPTPVSIQATIATITAQFGSTNGDLAGFAPEDLLPLPETDAFPKGVVAIMMHELSESEQRPVFLRITAPELVSEALEAAARKAEMWVQNSHTSATTFPVSVLEATARQWAARNWELIFTQQHVDDVYMALLAKQHNQGLEIVDGEKLCRLVGLDWNSVQRGLSLLQTATLIGAPSREAFAPDVRQVSEVVLCKPLAALGVDNYAFALAPRQR